MIAPHSGLDTRLQGLNNQPDACRNSPHPRASLLTDFLEPFSFYHPEQENCMVDDASRLFYLFCTVFFDHLSAAYPQTLGLW